MVYKVSITGDVIKLAQGAYSSYKLYLEKKGLLLNKKLRRKLQKQKKKLKKKLYQKVLRKKKTIKNLENILKLAEKNCKAASQDAESMQNTLKDAVTKNAKDIVIKEIMNS